MSEEKLLSIEDIKDAPDTEYDTVDAFGGKVRIGTLDSGTLLDFLEANKGPAKRTAGLRLIVASLVDKDGNRIGEPHHLEIFRKKSAKECTKLITAIRRLNGLEVEKEEVKNVSSEAATDDSPTVLH